MIDIGGDKWEFGISDGPATVQHVKVVDHRDGTYTMEFILPASGTYVCRLLLDGHHVQGSPWRVSANWKHLPGTNEKLLNFSSHVH